MTRPPTIAPGIDVNPPSISTGSAFSATRLSENCTPSSLPQMMPATSATKPATLQTMTQMRFSGMPIDCAAWWSSATARSARPALPYAYWPSAEALAEVSDFLKKDDDPAYQKCSDGVMAIYLNGLINVRRGKRDGPQPEPETEMTNNIVFKKLKIALNLKAEDTIEILALALDQEGGVLDILNEQIRIAE